MAKKVTLKEMVRYIGKLSKGPDHELMDDIGNEVADGVKLNIYGGKFKPISKLTRDLRPKGKGSGSGGPLNASGDLKKSIVHNVQSATKVEVGTPLIYAPLMQEGGTVKPKKAKKLAIPASRKIASMSSTIGVMATLKKYESMGYSIWFTLKAIMGTKGEKTKHLFIRKDSVDIPARPFMYMSDETKKTIQVVYSMWAGAL